MKTYSLELEIDFNIFLKKQNHASEDNPTYMTIWEILIELSGLFF